MSPGEAALVKKLKDLGNTRRFGPVMVSSEMMR
jgi:hypothetical protein